jgi:CHRD domain
MQRRIMAILTTLLVAIALIVALPGSSAAHDSRLLSARLSGANEVPPADPDGSGDATVALGRDAVCFTLSWNNINQPFAGHIHRGAAGINGPIVVGFFQKTPTTPLPAGISSAAGCVQGVDPALIAEIRGNPAGFYVNLHTADFPGGAIRGQLHR